MAIRNDPALGKASSAEGPIPESNGGLVNSSALFLPARQVHPRFCCRHSDSRQVQNYARYCISIGFVSSRRLVLVCQDQKSQAGLTTLDWYHYSLRDAMVSSRNRCEYLRVEKVGSRARHRVDGWQDTGRIY